MITLTNAGVTLILPDALNWIDEFSWSPIEQSKTYMSTGALHIEEHVKQAGRPVTLEGDQKRSWCTRALVKTLKAWAATPNITLQLTIRGEAFEVTFDHEKGALQGFPVMFYVDDWVEDSDKYYPTIRLIEI